MIAAIPAIAVLAPIRVPDAPMRSISRESKGTERLRPTPTAVMQPIAAAMEALRARTSARLLKASSCLSASLMQSHPHTYSRTKAPRFS